MKNTEELRAFLLETMRKVISEEIPIATSKGVSNLSQQVYNTLSMELKYAQVEAKLGEGRIKPVPFGDDKNSA